MDEGGYRRIVEGMAADHRRQLGELRALHAVYRALLDRAGISCPDDTDGQEALRRYRVLFEAHGFDDPEQHPELLAAWWA